MRSRISAEVTDQRTRRDFARVIKTLVDEQFRGAEQDVLVRDNLNPHGPASLYEAFEPAEAKRLADRIQWHYTPRHGSWLNVAEIELSVLAYRCLAERMDSRENLQEQVAARPRHNASPAQRKPGATQARRNASPAQRKPGATQARRNASSVTIGWRFTTEDARIKMKRLYPTILSG